jgi:hypothetical protein
MIWSRKEQRQPTSADVLIWDNNTGSIAITLSSEKVPRTRSRDPISHMLEIVVTIDEAKNGSLDRAAEGRCQHRGELSPSIIQWERG